MFKLGSNLETEQRLMTMTPTQFLVCSRYSSRLGLLKPQGVLWFSCYGSSTISRCGILSCPLQHGAQLLCTHHRAQVVYNYGPVLLMRPVVCPVMHIMLFLLEIRFQLCVHLHLLLLNKFEGTDERAPILGSSLHRPHPKWAGVEVSGQHRPSILLNHRQRAT